MTPSYAFSLPASSNLSLGADGPDPANRLAKSSKARPCEEVGKRQGNRAGDSRTIIRDSNLIKGALETMGGRRNKRGRAAEAVSVSPVKKKVGAMDKDLSEKKTVGKGLECEKTSKAVPTNINSGVIKEEGEKVPVTMASSETIAEMECEEQTLCEEKSEGEVVSDEDGENSGRSSAESMYELSEQERVRRLIRERNLKKAQDDQDEKGHSL